MTKSTVFTSNRSQAVRLPKAVAFPEGVHQVDILKIGRSRVIVPQGTLFNGVVVRSKNSGRWKGRAVMALRLIAMALARTPRTARAG